MKNILVPIDLSDFSSAVLDHAERQARLSSAKLWLMHVALPEPEFVGYEPGPQSTRDDVAGDMRAEHRRLEAMVNALKVSGIDATPLFVQGNTAEKIVEHASKLPADLIVMGSHGYGWFKRAWLGSVSEAVLRRTDCPLLIVPVGKRS